MTKSIPVELKSKLKQNKTAEVSMDNSLYFASTATFENACTGQRSNGGYVPSNGQLV